MVLSEPIIFVLDELKKVLKKVEEPGNKVSITEKINELENKLDGLKKDLDQLKADATFKFIPSSIGCDKDSGKIVKSADYDETRSVTQMNISDDEEFDFSVALSTPVKMTKITEDLARKTPASSLDDSGVILSP